MFIKGLRTLLVAVTLVTIAFGTPVWAANLVTNGDFSAGASGWQLSNAVIEEDVPGNNVVRLLESGEVLQYPVSKPETNVNYIISFDVAAKYETVKPTSDPLEPAVMTLAPGLGQWWNQKFAIEVVHYNGEVKQITYRFDTAGDWIWETKSFSAVLTTQPNGEIAYWKVYPLAHWLGGNSHLLVDNISIRVAVDDTLAIICPDDITVEAGPGCEAVVVLDQPTITASYDYTLSNTAPAVFPLGTTIVTWTATSVLGNTVNCNQKVTVVDPAAPIPGPNLVTNGDFSAGASGWQLSNAVIEDNAVRLLESGEVLQYPVSKPETNVNYIISFDVAAPWETVKSGTGLSDPAVATASSLQWIGSWWNQKFTVEVIHYNGEVVRLTYRFDTAGDWIWETKSFSAVLTTQPNGEVAYWKVYADTMWFNFTDYLIDNISIQDEGNSIGSSDVDCDGDGIGNVCDTDYEVGINIDPDVIHLGRGLATSKGKPVVTAYITSDCIDVTDIDVSTVVLTGATGSTPAIRFDVQGTTLMVKFDKQDVVALGLLPDGTFEVTGYLADGVTLIHGADSVIVK